MPPGHLRGRRANAARSNRARTLGAPIRELYLKLEVLQPIGSFKIRGAYNVVRQLSPASLTDGVWTVSAGNAAQGVALPREKSARPARCW